MGLMGVDRWWWGVCLFDGLSGREVALLFGDFMQRFAVWGGLGKSLVKMHFIMCFKSRIYQ